jgi:hypothetical protein
MFKKKNTTHLRAYPETKSRIKKATEDISKVEGKKVTTPELLKRMSNVPNIKNILIRDAQIKKKMRKFNRRGQLLPFNIGAMFVIGIVILAVFLLFFIGGLFIPQLVEQLGGVSNTLSEVAQKESNLNQTVEVTVVPLNQGLVNLEWISYGMLIMALMGIFIMAFAVRTYPVLLPVWIGLVMVLAFLGIIFANAYEGILASDGNTKALYESYEVNHFILSNLPFVIAVIGLLGGLIMFVALTTDPNRGEEAIV